MRLRTTAISLLLVGLVLLSGCASVGVTPDPALPSSSSPTAATPTVATPTSDATGTLEIHYIDVGQGSATLLVGPTNETMLIDSGDWQEDGAAVIEYLQRENLTRLDYLVTSHADADHIGGHAAIINYLETDGDGVGVVYDPGIAASTQTYNEYLDAIETHDVTLYRTQAGDTIPFEGVNVDVLAPPESYLADRDRNENSVVLKITHGNASFLFTGDAADAEEQYLLRQYRSGIDSTVLQAGHHGSRTSSSGPFLDAVSPTIVVISSNYDSRYGHPHNETLDRLAARGVTTFWTGIHGTIELVSDGSSVSIFTQAAATTDPLALRSAPENADGVEGELVFRGSIDATGSAEAPVLTTDGGVETTTDEATPTEQATQPSGNGVLAVTTIHADASGDERENLNDEFLVFTNEGDSTLDLSGWTVEDEADHRYSFPAGFTLDPGASVTLHTGSGADTWTDLYWGAEQAVWNNGGDTIIVTNAEGERVLEESY